jgi:hypothetical protein
VNALYVVAAFCVGWSRESHHYSTWHGRGRQLAFVGVLALLASL